MTFLRAARSKYEVVSSTVEVKKGYRILDLRNEKDLAYWNKSGLPKKIGVKGFAQLAMAMGVDGLLDDSGYTIYNPNAIS